MSSCPSGCRRVTVPASISILLLLLTTAQGLKLGSASGHVRRTLVTSHEGHNKKAHPAEVRAVRAFLHSALTLIAKPYFKIACPGPPLLIYSDDA